MCIKSVFSIEVGDIVSIYSHDDYTLLHTVVLYVHTIDIDGGYVVAELINEFDVIGTVRIKEPSDYAPRVLSLGGVEQAAYFGDVNYVT